MVDLSPRLPPERIALHQVRLPLIDPFVSARTTVTHRDLILVSMSIGDVTGWGECAPYPSHTRETVEDAWDDLRRIVPALLGGSPRLHTEGPPTVAAALAGAAADLAARLESQPLWRVMGGTDGPVAAGAAVGLASDTAALLTQVETAVAQGYRHVKLKIAPGADVACVAAVRRSYPGLGLGVDANGAYTRDTAMALAGLDDLEVAYLEQPLAAPDLSGTRRLGATLRTPICLDESVPTEAAALAAIERHDAPILNLKPGRLGTAACLRVHDAALAAGVALRVGGLIESGVGRGHAVSVATLPGCSVPGDLAASGRYFARDVVDPPWELVDGALHPPRSPGLGVAPLAGSLERFATRTIGFE